MDSAIEVAYAGVVVGRATHVRDWTADGAFIGFPEPLPTGTPIELRGDQVRQAKVEAAVESSDPAICGMRVSFSVAAQSSSSAPSSSVSVSPSVSPSISPSPAEPAESPSPDPKPEANQPGPTGGGGHSGKRRRRR